MISCVICNGPIENVGKNSLTIPRSDINRYVEPYQPPVGWVQPLIRAHIDCIEDPAHLDPGAREKWYTYKINQQQQMIDDLLDAIERSDDITLISSTYRQIRSRSVS